MAADFEPYYKWLGIPPEEQPPNHYRLLGIQTLEQNVEVIEAAANRQMAYLQQLSSGDDHVDEAQRLLGEVARARVCLLAAESKARYDAELTTAHESPPEAEEDAPENVAVPEFDSAARGATAPRRPATRRRGGKKRGSTARRSGRRSPPTKNTSQSAAQGEDDATAPTGSSSLQVKLAAAVIPAVVVVLIGLVWMVAGGDSSSEQAAKNHKENKTGSSASLDQDNENDPLAAAATKNFGDQTEDTGANSPAKQVNNQPALQVTKKEAPPTPPAVATPPSPPETLSTDESEAKELLVNENLEPVGLNKWRDKTLHREIENLVELLEQPAKIYNPTEQEIDKKIQDKKRSIGSQNKKLWNDYKHQTPEFDRNSALLASVGKFEIQDHVTLYFPEAPNQPFHYPAKKVAPISLRDEAIKELQNQASEILSTQARKDLQTKLREIHNKLTKRYVELKAREEIKDALDKVAGEFSEPPVLPKATNSESTQFTSAGSPADDPSNNNSEQDDPSTDSGDKGEQKKPTKIEPTLSYAKLKEELTKLEKNTRSSLSAFNTGAKEYIQQKENLGKRIEKGEKVLAQQTNLLIRMPENTEAQRIKKQETGKKIEEKITGPLDGLKSQRDKIPKPDTAQIEDNLSQAKKMLEQIQGLPEYAANPKSIDSLAEKIAKYRRGFEVQQTKMAK